MIVLLTDYGYTGPYVGQLKAKILQHCPTANIIDLMHDLPAYEINAAATLIPAITKKFPKNTIFICVVDPGVGSSRKPVLIKTDSYFIGPDNGIFELLIANTTKVSQWEIVWQPNEISNSFHGRDLFAPIASQLHSKIFDFENGLKEYPITKKLMKPKSELIYFDGFGNAITSISAENISEQARLEVSNIILSYARVFSEVAIGQSFWTKNSIGLVEIACNQGNAKNSLNLNFGDSVQILL